VEREIARITSLSSHDNPEERRLVNELESILRSMLKDIEITKDLEGKESTNYLNVNPTTDSPWDAAPALF